jgi:hypothetical protein
MSYTFDLVLGTDTRGYYDLTYGNNSIYGLQDDCVVKVNGNTAVTIPITPTLNMLRAIAVSATNIYVGKYISDFGICIYKLDLSGNFLSSFSTGSPQSMTLNNDGSILYFANSNKIYSVITSTFNAAEPLDFTASSIDMISIRFYQNKLYILNRDRYAEIFDLTEKIKTVVVDDGQTSFEGGTVSSTGDWYFSRRNISSSTNHFLYQIKLGDPLGTATTIVDTTAGLYDTVTPLTTSFEFLAFNNNNSNSFLYYANTNNSTYSGIRISNAVFCFNQGTKILCLNEELFDEYIPIEQLQLGNYVKTFKHGYRKIIKIIKGSFRNNPNKWNMCMYKMTKTDSNGLLEDLIVTGGHSILVDSISEEQQSKYDEMGITEFSKLTIDGKHLLLACVSDQFVPMSDNEVYTYYHLLLNNDNDKEERFGIWANGILTETPNEKNLQ